MYRIPVEMQSLVRTHFQVVVPFGKKRYYVGIIKQVHENNGDAACELKDIVAVLDKWPVIHPSQMRLWEWIASYYLCKLGDVYKAAIPPSLLRHEKTKRFVSKKETCIRLTTVCNDEEVLNALFGSLKRAKQQERLLLTYMELACPFQPESKREVSKMELLKASGIHSTVLDTLIKRKILESYERDINRIQHPIIDFRLMSILTDAQQTALADIQTVFATKPVCLFHGVSMCGKTEIYIHLIVDTLQRGLNVLCLLPEIAITERFTKRMKCIFGDRLLVYHSGFSDNKREEVWNSLLHAKESMFVMGVRSSVFLPFSNLGLVIVDDEHDASYRQQDPAPRFHARNAAIMLAHIHGARTLLGSATPSLESYYNAGIGKYGLITLNVRYANMPPNPFVETVNVNELKRKKIMKESLFAPILKDNMEDALKRDEQIIIFQNRRGFALVMECKSCGYVAGCINCDVSLTCHKHVNRLVCHYCGYSVALPSQCPSCGGKEMKLAGSGTEKVEEEIETLFPDVKISRLDHDTARTRGAYERIITNFEQGESKILIGTQMLAKGLDVNKVSVVGILNADSLMNIPDFRSHERAFQLMTQLSSHAGQCHKQGTVVIQTAQPEHPLIKAIQTFDYKRMAIDQLNERKTFRYPPYYRLIVPVLRCNNEQTLEQVTARYAEILCNELGERVLPPFAPPINRVQTLHVRHIMLKLEISFPITNVRAILDKVNRQMHSFPGFSRIMLHYEVDN